MSTIEMLPEITKNIHETNKQVLSQSFSLIASAFVLIAALAWNDLIKDTVTRYLNAGSGLISRLIYALIVTIIAVIVTTRLNKLSERLTSQDNNQNKQ